MDNVRSVAGRAVTRFCPSNVRNVAVLVVDSIGAVSPMSRQILVMDLMALGRIWRRGSIGIMAMVDDTRGVSGRGGLGPRDEQEGEGEGDLVGLRARGASSPALTWAI